MQRNRLSSFQFGALVKFVSRCRFGHTVASHVSLEDFVIRLMSIVSQEPALKKRKKLSTSRFPRWEKVIRKFASRCGSIVLIDLLSFFYFEERKKTPISRSLRGRRSCMATPTESDLFFALFAHRDRCSLNVRSVTYTLPPPPPPPCTLRLHLRAPSPRHPSPKSTSLSRRKRNRRRTDSPPLDEHQRSGPVLRGLLLGSAIRSLTQSNDQENQNAPKSNRGAFLPPPPKKKKPARHAEGNTKQNTNKYSNTMVNQTKKKPTRPGRRESLFISYANAATYFRSQWAEAGA